MLEAWSPSKFVKWVIKNMSELVSVVKTSLINKAREIRSRILIALDQLNEDQLNWRYNIECNSIANLIVHIKGNIHQRIESGILGKPDTRNRDVEFESDVRLNLNEAKTIISKSFDLLEKTISDMPSDDLLKEQKVRSKTVTVYEVLNQCNAHFSEHMGQILYISKMLLEDKYISTSIPKKR